MSLNKIARIIPLKTACARLPLLSRVERERRPDRRLFELKVICFQVRGGLEVRIQSSSVESILDCLSFILKILSCLYAWSTKGFIDLLLLTLLGGLLLSYDLSLGFTNCINFARLIFKQ